MKMSNHRLKLKETLLNYREQKESYQILGSLLSNDSISLSRDGRIEDFPYFLAQNSVPCKFDRLLELVDGFWDPFP